MWAKMVTLRDGQRTAEVEIDSPAHRTQIRSLTVSDYEGKPRMPTGISPTPKAERLALVYSLRYAGYECIKF